ncbi:MAG: lipopolysaccharide kinase InaA family protein [Verrucomicrobiales bacterium]|nr:lipopolysaccharide kinase InaA family protein [Verrucomicrobiales bacterium]
MKQIAALGLDWDLEPSFEPWLTRVWNTPGRAVKESPVKLVTRHELEGRVFFVKRYRHAAAGLRPLKFLFKPAQSRREWRLAQELARRGVPIVRHLAHGERWTWRGLAESVLITEGFDGVPLDEAERPDLQAVLRFVEQMHARGVLQRDLHPGNVLVGRQTGELRLVDLHGIELKPAISPEERDANLAFLRIFLPVPVSAEIERRAALLRRAYLAHRSRRCLKHNREFAPMRFGALRWQVRRPWLTPELEEVLGAPDEFLSARARLLKRGRASTVGLADGLVLKRYNLRWNKPENLLKDCFRRSKARRAFRKAYHLELAGVPTARPIATADVRRCGLLLRSYLVMEAIPDAADLGRWRGEPRVALRAAAELIARLHDEGFAHRDLKETNLIFDGQGRLFLIDLEGLDFEGHVPLPRARADLARFARAVQSLPHLRDFYRAEFLEPYCRLRNLNVTGFEP